MLLVWLGKVTIQEVKLDKDLKSLAKELGLKFLRNQDKAMHIRAISSALLKRQLVKVTKPLTSISREDVVVKVSRNDMHTRVHALSWKDQYSLSSKVICLNICAPIFIFATLSMVLRKETRHDPRGLLGIHCT